MREPWPRFVGGIERLGSAGLDQRREQARRLLRENGVTYNVFGAPQGPDRPWELDPLPLVISNEEWNRLSKALAQRVTVLNAILADLYGPQQLLSRGVLPPELVFAHPGFLVPCHNLKVAGGVHLHLYAGHIVRGPDGRWVVVADRTQGPSGAGYAVENRVIMSRILPQDFHALYVERLASFFIALRETLVSIAPRNRDNPRVVLLSPGTRSATYFEDGYLSRYLGYSLAEGGDLTVRGSQVFLKTLGGLLPVDVILRRVPDEECRSARAQGRFAIGRPRPGRGRPRRAGRRRQLPGQRLSRSAGPHGLPSRNLSRTSAARNSNSPAPAPGGADGPTTCNTSNRICTNS